MVSVRFLLLVVAAALLFALPSHGQLPSTSSVQSVVAPEHLPLPMGHSAAVWFGDSAYIFGGDNGTVRYNTITRYQPGKGALPAGALPMALSGVAAASDGHSIFLFGGWIGNRVAAPGYDLTSPAILRYLPGTPAAVPVGQFFPGGLSTRLPTGIAEASAVFANGRIYVLGGWDGGIDGRGTLDTIYAFDPVNSTLSDTGAHLPYGFAAGNAAWDGYEIIYYAGSTIFRYNPTTNHVGVEPHSNGVAFSDPTLEPDYKYGSAAWVDNRTLIFGGMSNGQPESRVLRDEGCGYTHISDMPNGAYGLAAAYDGHANVYLFGGYRPSPTDAIIRYAVAPASPSDLCMPYDAADTSSVSLEGRGYIFGGVSVWGDLHSEILQLAPGDHRARPVGNLPTARLGTAAVTDGHSIFILGGDDGTGPISDIIRYVPGQPVARVASLPAPRSGASAIFDGQSVYIFGGKGPQGLLASIVKFDPKTNQSVTLSVQLPLPTDATSAVWDGHYAYVFGGSESPFSRSWAANGAYRFSPSAQTVELLPVAFLLQTGGKLSGTSAVWSGSAAYVFGGRDYFPSSSKAVGGTFLFNPCAVTLGQISTIPDSRSETSAFLQQGLGLVAGGRDGPTNKWHQTSGHVFRDLVPVNLPPPEPAPCRQPTMLRLPYILDGEAGAQVGNFSYLFGGYSEGNTHNLRRDVIRYDGQGLPMLVGTAPWARSDMGAASDGQSIFLFGGQSEGQATADVVKFTPPSDFVVVAQLPKPASGTSAVFDGRDIIVFGVDDLILRFSPASFSLETMPERMPQAVASPGAFWNGQWSSIFIVTNDPVTALIRFDPATGNVEPWPDYVLPGSYGRPFAVAAGDRGYFAAGGQVFAFEPCQDHWIIQNFSRFPAAVSTATYNPRLKRGYVFQAADITPVDGVDLGPGPCVRPDFSSVLKYGTVQASAGWIAPFGYIFGGQGRDGILRYDPSGTPSQMIGKLPEPRWGMASVSTDSTIYLGGGQSRDGLSDEVIAFTPSGGLQVVGHLPHAVTNASAVWDGHEMFLFGGTTLRGLSRDILAFDPSTSASWIAGELTQAIQGSTAVWDGTAAFVIGGADGRTGASHQVTRFLPGSGEAVRFDVDLPENVTEAASALDGGGGWYVLGGATPGSYLAATNQVWHFLPCLHAFRREAPLRWWDGGMAYTKTDDNRLFLLSGFIDLGYGPQPLNRVMSYDLQSTECPDTTPPRLSLPPALVIEATGQSTVVDYLVNATDNRAGQVVVICNPPSGSAFLLGTTSVVCSAIDAAGNQANGTFDVTVVDTTPPRLDVPASIQAYATSAGGAAVAFSAAAADVVDGTVPVACGHAAESTFPVGQTVVSCTATDAHGNVASAWFLVKVTYDWGGFLAPPANATEHGQSVRVAFRLQGASGNVTDANATLWVAPVHTDGTVGDERAAEGVAGATHFAFQSGAYKYHWSTTGLAPGPWRLRVDLGDGVVHVTQVTLS